MAHPPKSLQAILWSSDVNQLDIEKNKGYIIHQLLMYGNLDELRWLFQTYSKRTVVDIFLSHPAKLYPKEMFPFIKDYILGLRGVSINEEDYVTSFFGPVRQRTASRLA